MKRLAITLALVQGFLLLAAAASAQSFTRVSGWKYHTLALTSNGDVYAWGRSDKGQAGAGGGNISFPLQVFGLPRPATAIAAGGFHSVALLDDDTVWTWGSNDRGQLGNGFMDTNSNPWPRQVFIPFSDPVIAIAAGEKHTFAVTDRGDIWAWGWNHDGQLGIGNDDHEPSPTSVLRVFDGVDVAAGYDWALFLEDGGAVLAAGENRYGQLGNGSTVDTESNPPVFVAGLFNGSKISAGYGHGLALEGSSLYAWGRTNSGQACIGISGSGRFVTTPRRVSGVSGVVQAEAGSTHTLIRRSNGEVWSCGQGLPTGQASSTSIYSTPTPIFGLSNVTYIAAGRTHSMAVTNDGRIWTWGSNSHGQLGWGSIGSGSRLPTPVN